MKVTAKKTGENTMHLEAVATPAEVNAALEGAQRAFAQNMGLRPQKDKTIAQVAEEVMGIKNLDSVVETGAIEALVPMALDRKNIIPAYIPKAAYRTSLKRGREFTFSLNVQLKPAYELTSYDPVEIVVRPFTFDESLVDAQIEDLAQHSIAYVKADPKPIEKGDVCLIDMECTQDGEEVKNLTAKGRMYMAGMNYMPDDFDSQILGMQPGDSKEFTFELPSFDDEGKEITKPTEAKVTVVEIQKQEVPVIDDAWVEKNMPMFKSLASMREQFRMMLEQQARAQYDRGLMGMAADQLSRRFQGKIPDEVYESMRSVLVGNMRMEAQREGVNFEDFIKQNGGEQQFGMMVMIQARSMLVQGYALDAVFRHDHLSLTDADLNAACREMNPNMNPKAFREQVEQSGRSFALRETAERMKANRWVLDHAKITYRDPDAEKSAANETAEPSAADSETNDDADKS